MQEELSSYLSRGITVGAVLLMFGLAWGLSGCASPSATPVSLDDGSRGELIQCDGMYLSKLDCLEHANKVCDNDYEVIATTGQWYDGGGVVGVLKDMDRAMIIRCRNAADE